jgi:hypothetical protein
VTDLVKGNVVGIPVFECVDDTDCVYDDDDVMDLVKGNVVGIEERDSETVTVEVGTNDDETVVDPDIDCVPERVFGTEVAIGLYDNETDVLTVAVELALAHIVLLAINVVLVVCDTVFVFGKELGIEEEVDVSCGVVDIIGELLSVYNPLLDILFTGLDEIEFVNTLVIVM